jgi:dihydrofolate synthase/folylpolyglutamate synthase
MPAEELARKASHLQGVAEGAFQDVPSAYRAAKRNATDDDLIFIGGSTFVVADLLADILPSE